MMTRRIAAFSIVFAALLALSLPALAQPIPRSPSPGPSAAAGVRLVSKDGRVALNLPAGWTEQPTDSSERVQATDGTHYVLVITENKEDFANLRAYTETVRKQMTGRLTDADNTDITELRLGGNPAMRCEIFGTHSSGVRVGFLVTVVETGTRFTQVIGWAARSAYRTDREILASLPEGLEESPR